MRICFHVYIYMYVGVDVYVYHDFLLLFISGQGLSWHWHLPPPAVPWTVGHDMMMPVTFVAVELEPWRLAVALFKNLD